MKRIFLLSVVAGALVAQTGSSLRPDERVAVLESRTNGLQTRLDAIDTRLTRMDDSLTDIKVQLASANTKLNILTGILSAVALGLLGVFFKKQFEEKAVAVAPARYSPNHLDEAEALLRGISVESPEVFRRVIADLRGTRSDLDSVRAERDRLRAEAEQRAEEESSKARESK